MFVGMYACIYLPFIYCLSINYLWSTALLLINSHTYIFMTCISIYIIYMHLIYNIYVYTYKLCTLLFINPYLWFCILLRKENKILKD